MQQMGATTSATFSAQRMKRIAVLLPDALRDALGQIVAGERREWRRERELAEAQRRADMAELRASYDARLEEICVETAARVDALVAARLASIRDGVDGRDGADAPPVDDVMLSDAVARYFAANPPPAGIDGKDGRNGADGKDGKDGAPGLLPVVRGWTDEVHYAGALVTHDGATWQAQRDTGRAPPHDDWLCIASAGRDGADGRSMTIRGTWSEAETYRALDVVALNGASFAARRDDPGACPGDGWQMIAAQGKRGNPGEPGRPARGDRGPPGPSVVAMEVDGDGLLTLTNADGSAVTLDLYPLLSRLARH